MKENRYQHYDHLEKLEEKAGREILWIITGFVIFYTLFYLLEGPIHVLISHFIELRSEYTVGEQLSKFYLFSVLLVSYFSYRILSKPEAVKLSIGFLLFSLVMYLSESNMIRETAQPVFGIIGIAFTAYYLYRLRLWASFFLFFTAFVFLSFGSLVDFIHERAWINTLIPDFLYTLLDMASEERFDVIGAMFFSLSAVLAFWRVIKELMKTSKKELVFSLLFSFVMTVGNGFVHYQYQPEGNFYLFAVSMSMAGFLGMILYVSRMFKKVPSRSSVPDLLFFAALFFGFVVLPGYGFLAWFASEHSLILWIPVIGAIGLYMYLSHTFEKGKE
jgi:hypothetical protein